MLCSGVAACHRYGACTVRCVECEWYVYCSLCCVRVVCVLFAVLSASGMCTVRCAECEWYVYCSLC